MPFGPETFSFLTDLTEHNERPWFEANRERYEAHVRTPALAFVRAMAERLPAVAPELRADDRKSGGSLMRVFRDTRFSKDKLPYKTNVGIQLRQETGTDVHAPSVYVHLALDGCFVGLGTWGPEPAALDLFRRRIVDDGDSWRAIVDDPGFRRTFPKDDHGDTLKRAPKGYDPDHPLVEVLKRKSHLVSADLERSEVCSEGFPDRITERIAVGLPYLRFLTEAILD